MARTKRTKVRCVGKPAVVGLSETGKYDRVIQQHTKPCGWTGWRTNQREFYGPVGMTPAAEVEPCPRCGGRVVLDPSED
jgi:hypothetical protein